MVKSMTLLNDGGIGPSFFVRLARSCSLCPTVRSARAAARKALIATTSGFTAPTVIVKRYHWAPESSRKNTCRTHGFFSEISRSCRVSIALVVGRAAGGYRSRCRPHPQTIDLQWGSRRDARVEEDAISWVSVQRRENHWPGFFSCPSFRRSGYLLGTELPQS